MDQKPSKEFVKTLLQAVTYEIAFDMLLDKFVNVFLIKNFEDDVYYPDFFELKENLRREMVDKASTEVAKQIEEVFKETKLKTGKNV